MVHSEGLNPVQLQTSRLMANNYTVWIVLISPHDNKSRTIRLATAQWLHMRPACDPVKRTSQRPEPPETVACQILSSIERFAHQCEAWRLSLTGRNLNSQCCEKKKPLMWFAQCLVFLMGKGFPNLRVRPHLGSVRLVLRQSVLIVLVRRDFAVCRSWQALKILIAAGL